MKLLSGQVIKNLLGEDLDVSIALFLQKAFVQARDN